VYIFFFLELHDTPLFHKGSPLPLFLGVLNWCKQRCPISTATQLYDFVDRWRRGKSQPLLTVPRSRRVELCSYPQWYGDRVAETLLLQHWASAQQRVCTKGQRRHLTYKRQWNWRLEDQFKLVRCSAELIVFQAHIYLC